MKALESLIEPYRNRLKIKTDVLMGTGFLEIIRAVLRNSHDLLIKPAENPDFMKRLFGSNDMHLLRKCPCPVWIMKLPEKPKYDRILAGVDFDPLMPEEGMQALNLKILGSAGSLALADGASLHLAHAWEAYAETAMRVSSDISYPFTGSKVQRFRVSFLPPGFHVGGGLSYDNPVLCVVP